MGRPIIRDPAILSGLPHVEGTARTVAEVQSFWRRPGVGAVQARQQFPDLTEAELGAVVTWTEPRLPEFAFVATWSGPPQRKLSIYGDLGNWMFEYSDAQTPGWDVWEARFADILRYPEVYASREVEWRNAQTGDVVDIYGLVFNEALA